jgi:uncharacterized membrane protein YqiK
LKLKCDEPLSNFAFSFNWRRYAKEAKDRMREMAMAEADLTLAKASAEREASRAKAEAEAAKAEATAAESKVGWCRLTLSNPS